MDAKVRSKLLTSGFRDETTIAGASVKVLKENAGLTHTEARSVRKLIPYRKGAVQVDQLVERRHNLAEARVLTQEDAREAFAARIPVLEGLVDDPGTNARVKVQAMGLLGRYGVGRPDTGQSIRPEDVRELVKALALATEPLVPPEKQKDMSNEWYAIIRDRFPAITG